MTKHNSHAYFKVEHGKVVLHARGSNSHQRVVVADDGSITNRLKFGQNTVEHFFALHGDARFLEFELKHSAGKPGYDDFQVEGHTLANGKVTFSPPVQSFVLRNLNRTKSEFDYGFAVRDGDARVEFDPAVRNVGNPHVLLNPLIVAALAGFVIGVAITVASLAALRPRWLSEHHGPAGPGAPLHLAGAGDDHAVGGRRDS